MIWLKYCRYGVKHYPINQSMLNSMRGYTWRNFTFDIKKVIYNWLIEDYLTSRLKIVHSWKGVTIASEWLHNLVCLWSLFTDLKQAGRDLYRAVPAMTGASFSAVSSGGPVWVKQNCFSKIKAESIKTKCITYTIWQEEYFFFKRTFKKNLSTKYWSYLLDFYILKRFFPRNLYDTKCLLR